MKLRYVPKVIKYFFLNITYTDKHVMKYYKKIWVFYLKKTPKHFIVVSQQLDFYYDFIL